MDELEFIETKDRTVNQFSKEFIEKYKYCPVTNAVLNTLFRNGNKIQIIEQILTLFEDTNKQLNEIQIDCITKTGKPYQIK